MSAGGGIVSNGVLTTRNLKTLPLQEDGLPATPTRPDPHAATPPHPNPHNTTSLHPDSHDVAPPCPGSGGVTIVISNGEWLAKCPHVVVLVWY